MDQKPHMLIRTFWPHEASIDRIDGRQWLTRSPAEVILPATIEGETSSDCCGHGPFALRLTVVSGGIHVTGWREEAACGGPGSSRVTINYVEPWPAPGDLLDLLAAEPDS